MSEPIHFHFDYSSPYGYLASERIEALAKQHGREVQWHPILLGAVFKVTGLGPLLDVPMKGDYATMDFARAAREHGLTYVHPETFPFASVAACRATLWLRDNADASLSSRTSDLVHVLYRASFQHGRDIGNVDTVVELAGDLGIDRDALIAALGDADIKNRLRVEVESAIEQGVFGSPMLTVDGEQFWGHDRLEQLDRWLKRGGW